MVKESIAQSKAEEFALRIIKLYAYLRENHSEYVLSVQILKSGTSVGANIAEAKYAQSTADFISKNSIALKEAAETEYWLRLLNKAGYINNKLFDSLYQDNNELVKMLSGIVLSSKEKLKTEESKNV